MIQSQRKGVSVKYTAGIPAESMYENTLDIFCLPQK